jgi:predicted transcriptional regulator
MTRDQVKEIIEGELYHPDDDEWAAIQQGLGQAKRGETVSADEIAKLLPPWLARSSTRRH